MDRRKVGPLLLLQLQLRRRGEAGAVDTPPVVRGGYVEQANDLGYLRLAEGVEGDRGARWRVPRRGLVVV